jgi:hypothetical protein
MPLLPPLNALGEPTDDPEVTYKDWVDVMKHLLGNTVGFLLEQVWQERSFLLNLEYFDFP